VSRPSFLFGLLSVLALLMLGAGGASASVEPMPCHEMGSAMKADAPAEAPAKAPGKAMVMACCVACVAPPLVQPRPAAAVRTPPLAVQPARLTLPTGRSPAPEPGPPKA